MKSILFICGSLVPGRDGVGDYTRRLAAELISAGYVVRLLSSHDRGVSSIVQEQQESNGVMVDVIRIPFQEPMRARRNTMQEQLDSFSPDWLSLQYVPYSFSKYGIPFGFIGSLVRLKGLPPVHVMFHELWIVPADLKGMKGKLTAALQRRAVGRIGRRLRPAMVHTHLPAYAGRLSPLGITARPLPLFANVARSATARPRTDDAFNTVFFSKMLFPPSVVDFLRRLTEDKKPLTVSLLGGSKEKVQTAAQTLRLEIPGISVDPVGFLSEEELSVRLAGADLAISPVPSHLLGKSGTIAAFFSHNLPVAAPYIREAGEGFFLPDLNRAVFSEYTLQAFEQARAAAKELDTTIISSEVISRRFAEDLEKCTPAPA